METVNLLKNDRIIDKLNEEYYHVLQTNIQFLGEEIQTIAITSVTSNEGKSVVSINLAMYLAQSGLRVLYVDADIRNSSFAGRFRLTEKVQGLTGFLAGTCSMKEIFSRTDVEGLDVIPSGKFPPNPTTLLQGKRFRDLIEITRKHYDYIIIDTPPVGTVIDAAIIANYCDGSAMVVESGKIKRKFVRKSIAQLEQSGKPFLGIILNKLDVSGSGYGNYGTYGSYGNYGKYGKR